jgi:Tfp pilus assembly protein PilO
VNEKSWNTVALTAIVVMALTVVAYWLFPVPALKKVTQTRRNQETDLYKDIEKIQSDIKVTRIRNQQRLWSQPADQVAAAAMAKVTQFAQAQSLKVLAFRPQRVQEFPGVTVLPYQVSMEGYFPKVMAFVRSMETSTVKLPVVNVQIAAADGASDKVTATIGIVAFREAETKKP